MPSFKTDDSFLEKIAIGAIGTRKVFDRLVELDQKPVELERGSMSYKIWKKIKIKRIRVPDILCVNSGIRVESRAKTKLEITMSHSFSDTERSWDYGLKNNDYAALVVCKKNGDGPIDWTPGDLVQFISIKYLRKAERERQTISEKPKGTQEGFETRLTWPSSIASTDGTIKQISGSRIQFSREKDNRTISLRLSKKGIKLKPLINIGDKIKKNQIIASVIPVNFSIPSIRVDENYYLTNLSSSSLSDRYTASKALSFFNDYKLQKALLKKINDEEEHIYVRLEAAASLARLDYDQGYLFVENCLNDSFLQNVLETIIVLSEIKSKRSSSILCSVLEDENQDPEIRAGAAWALGELNNKIALESLIKSFDLVNDNIRVESARALAKLTKDFSYDILDKFGKSDSIQKPGLAWALSKSKDLKISDLIKYLSDLESRKWMAYIIGMQGEEKYIAEIEKLKRKDKEVYFAVTVLWKIITSWVYNLREY